MLNKRIRKQPAVTHHIISNISQLIKERTGTCYRIKRRNDGGVVIEAERIRVHSHQSLELFDYIIFFFLLNFLFKIYQIYNI
jgi:hypothetical protein